MSLTITIPGAVNATTGATAPATLTVGVGIPGATGPAGPAGAGVPAGGTAGQFLTKIDGTNYNTDWTTVNLSQYLTTSAAAATYQPLSGMSSYLTTSSAASTYAPLARGLPASGTVGQVLTKVNGTDYNASWQTLVPGDRYLSSSTTSLTISTGAKTLTIGTGLSYSSQQDIVIAYDAANHMHAVVTSYDSSTGVMVVDVQNKTGSGTYSLWTVNVGGTVPLQSVNWGEIIGTLGNQTDLATALNAKLSTATAASTYAPLAGAVFTGEVATPASTTSSAGFSIAPGVAPSAPTNGEIWNSGTELLAQISGVSETLARQSWVTSQLGSYLTTSAASTTYAALAGATFTGLVSTPAATTASAFLRIAHGAAPTTPVNGDVWTTTSGLFARINGGTQQYAPLGSTNTFTGTNTFSGASVSVGTSTAASTYNIGTGATLTATTKAINIGTNGVSGSTTNITIGNSVSGATSTTTVAGTLNATGTSLDLGNSTAAATYNFGAGATLTATTKAVNIGTNGVAGSTTNIAIGSTTGTSTTTLQGTTNAVTAAQNTNTTQVATTAFVLGQASSTTPVVDGTAAVGTATTFARADHVHPTDTSRAALASPTFTGTPAAPTAAADTNTTQLATTAYVVGQASATSPAMDGTATIGTSLKYARADHIHPTDTSRAPLASPTFTGTPAAPTATAGTNTTQLATTAFVQSALPVMATETQAIYGTSSTTTISPLLMRYILSNPGYQTYNSLIGNYSSYVSGSGSVSTVFSNFAATQITAANGKAAFMPNNNASYHSIFSRGKAELNMDWSKPLWFAFRFCYSSGAQLGDTNTVNRVTFGKTSSYFGDLTDKGFGVKWTAGTTGAFTVMAYNGTTLSTSASSVTISNTTYFPTTTSAADFMVYSDGAGNITLYCNNVQVATTTGGPSSGTTPGPRFVFETDNTTSTTTTVTCDYYGIRSMLSY